MIDSDIYRKALARYIAARGENTVFKDNVIIFLEKEIDHYRDRIQHMEYNVERTSDSGRMTINYSGCYQDLAGILLANGYFVSCHVNKSDKKAEETITIEFWKE